MDEWKCGKINKTPAFLCDTKAAHKKKPNSFRLNAAKSAWTHAHWVRARAREQETTTRISNSNAIRFNSIHKRTLFKINTGSRDLLNVNSWLLLVNVWKHFKTWLKICFHWPNTMLFVITQILPENTITIIQIKRGFFATSFVPHSPSPRFLLCAFDQIECCWWLKLTGNISLHKFICKPW